MKFYRFFSIPASLCLTAAMLAGVSDLLAAPVDPDRAKDEASEFLNSAALSSRRNAPSASADVTLAYTGKENGLACYYIFNHDNGYVIVSADDRLPAVLGYSDNGSFDLQRIPDNMRWWLDQYKGEIAAFLPSAPENGSGHRIVARAPKRAPIAPMVTTLWDQGTPFNNDCPLDSRGQRSVTGCVATAMAQILKYHNWPDRPEGSSGGLVFNGTVYDWRNMIDDYSGTYSARQASAVATLMRQCGASVNMQYSSYMSGAYNQDVQNALI